jgi:glucose/arabinose dehydrogenase
MSNRLAAVLSGVALLLSVLARGEPQRQTFAPHELTAADAPPPIEWPTPALDERTIELESAEQRHLRVVVITRDLQQPWSMAFLPDGSMLITERPGRLRLLRKGKLESEPVHGLPEVYTGGPRGLQGLMDVALHPDFSQNGWLYLTYHKPTADGGAAALARGVWNGSGLVDVREVFDSGAVDTEASRVTFGRDGMLYMTIGAPGSPDVKRSQDPADYAGKVLRLRHDGSIPPDNPFVRRSDYKAGIYTVGHRNGHGLAANPDTGELWVTEQGPNGGDELNVLRPGGNYGWPIVSYGRDYWGAPISERPTAAPFTQPAVVWLPSIGLTGMTFYTGDRFPHWKGNVFVGGLREGGIPRTGQLQRIVFNERWEELRREPLLTELKQRIRDVREGPDGLVYVLTAEDEGALLRIEPGPRR